PDDRPQALARERPPDPPDEDGARVAALRESGTRCRQVLGEGRPGLTPQRNQPLAVALPAADQELSLEVDVSGAETHQLGGPEPGAIEKLEDRPVAEPPWSPRGRPFDDGGRIRP